MNRKAIPRPAVSTAAPTQTVQSTYRWFVELRRASEPSELRSYPTQAAAVRAALTYWQSRRDYLSTTPCPLTETRPATLFVWGWLDGAVLTVYGDWQPVRSGLDLTP